MGHNIHKHNEYKCGDTKYYSNLIVNDMFVYYESGYILYDFDICNKYVNDIRNIKYINHINNTTCIQNIADMMTITDITPITDIGDNTYICDMIYNKLPIDSDYILCKSMSLIGMLYYYKPDKVCIKKPIIDISDGVTTIHMSLVYDILFINDNDDIYHIGYKAYNKDNTLVYNIYYVLSYINGEKYLNIYNRDIEPDLMDKIVMGKFMYDMNTGYNPYENLNLNKFEWV